MEFAPGIPGLEKECELCCRAEHGTTMASRSPALSSIRMTAPISNDDRRALKIPERKFDPVPSSGNFYFDPSGVKASSNSRWLRTVDTFCFCDVLLHGSQTAATEGQGDYQNS